MALQFLDRVRCLSATTGTGPLAIGLPLAGYIGFAGMTVGNTSYYTIEDLPNWEIGLGTLTAAGTWTRTTVINTSAGNTSPISLSGNANFYLTFSATAAGAIAAETARALAAEAEPIGRNLLHNGRFAVQQRGAGAFTAGGYCADRWLILLNGDTLSTTIAALTDADRAAIGDESAQYGLTAAVTGAATAANYTGIMQRIEGVAGSSNKTVTFSFWARGSVPLNVGVITQQNFGIGGSPSASVKTPAVTVPITTAWARYTVTATLGSAAGKTFGLGSDYLGIYLFLSSGTTGQATYGVGAQSGTFTFWGMQVEFGSVASALEARNLPYELLQCQRFYTASSLLYAESYQAAAGNVGGAQALPFAMRTIPTISVTTNNSLNVSGFALTAQNGSFVFASGTATAAGTWSLNAIFNASSDL